MRLAEVGAHVLCLDRDLAAAQDTAARIEAAGGCSSAEWVNATDEAALSAVLANHHEPIDILVHVVGMSVPGGVIETEPADWDRVFAVNLRSAYLASRAVLPAMRARGSGVLVFVSSAAAVWSSGYSYAAYESSKAGLNRLVRSIARAHASEGIRANAVMPGMIDTPHVRAFIQDAQRTDTASRAEAVPMKRQGSPWDVANAALFLASDMSSYISGTCLPVDGGLIA